MSFLKHMRAELYYLIGIPLLSVSKLATLIKDDGT